MPEFIFTADIEKTYRQISVHEDHRKYQLILWRETQDGPISIYNLNTETYGVGPPAYQALRCIQQLAVLEASRFVYAQKMIKENMYVDDVFLGSHSAESAIDFEGLSHGVVHSRSREVTFVDQRTLFIGIELE